MMLSIGCVAVRSAKKYHFKMLNVTLVLDIFCRYRPIIQTHEALVFSYVASLLISERVHERQLVLTPRSNKKIVRQEGLLLYSERS